MKLVILESPFAGNVERNIAYAKLCIKDMLWRDEAPIASHLLFTQPGILDDKNPQERTLGLAAGHAWIEVSEGSAFYVDFGMSKGMEMALDKAMALGKKIETRHLPIEMVEKLKLDYPEKTK